jgi:hypothetical protein
MDAAGVLEEIGEGVQTDVSFGDHVMAIVLPEAHRRLEAGGVRGRMVIEF